MAADTGPDRPAGQIPLVMVGASAGGLEPLETFFAAAPDRAGWCFVVLQHLSPDYKSMMREQLSRRCRLAIRHIEDGLAPEPDTIFLNRAATVATLVDGVFRTRPQAAEDGILHLPIDAMFASAADRPPETTAAVILSGSGSDGTRGAQKLHAAGALVLAQSPAEAAFPSMPQSAISAEAADEALRTGEMPDALAAYFSTGDRSHAGRHGDDNFPSKSFLKLLEAAHGIDFSDYKGQNVRRRIERRCKLHGHGTAEEYLAALQVDSDALEELYHDLLIGVTTFYRNREAIRALREKVLDFLAGQDGSESAARIWVPACSSGEEAYTIAIEMCEALEQAGRRRNFRIIATDVHRRSIDAASAGIYPAEAMERMPQDIRDRYFDRVRDHYVVNPVLRQKIIFSVHDVLSDPPFMKLDLISCRNLLIYLTEAAQARLMSMFLFGLQANGALLLGTSESLGRFSQEFRPLDARWRLFRKATTRRHPDRKVMQARIGAGPRPEAPSRSPAAPEPSRTIRDPGDFRSRDALIRCYDAMLKRHAPSSILVTEHGVVVAWFGEAARVIDTMNNLAEWTVDEIVHRDLQFAINVAAEKLRQEQLRTYVRNVGIDFGTGRPERCEVRIEPLQEVQGSRLMLVTLVFEGETDAAPPKPAPEPLPADAPRAEDSRLLGRRIAELERDLRLTEETLQHVTERLEASGEELQASNEELQASNEELQASNEELQSSNEELHAVNEELISVSAEHERQIETLSELNRNIELVLDTLDVGVIFVDSDARVRRFSEIIAARFELEEHDVMRSVAVIGPRLSFVDLPAAVAEVLESGEPRRFAGLQAGVPLSVLLRPMLDETERGPGRFRIDGAALIFRWTSAG
ncbi:CheR family methyltransferase [Mangrovicoccus sp. HB161399]|uniref:CheR family methyltransferase n=1 Tax=Mangrovicoccus sp. HB161399 TaxID=2720392 RepID=UPI0020A6D76E|nr:CheR family methyltransferase [Mangrovicoccus sp. HB161399]